MRLTLVVLIHFLRKFVFDVQNSVSIPRCGFASTVTSTPPDASVSARKGICQNTIIKQTNLAGVAGNLIPRSVCAGT